MRVKITPLNIVSALGLMAAVLLLFNKKEILAPVNQAWNNLFIAICLIIVFVAFLSDQIFRRFFTSLLKIWIVESALIIFTIILFIILKITIVN